MQKTQKGRWLMVVGKGLMAMLLLMVAGATLTFLGITLMGSQAAFSAWQVTARPWLQVWRLAVYAAIAWLWWSRVRKAYLAQYSRWAVCRIELMLLALFALIEFAVHHKTMFQGA